MLSNFVLLLKIYQTMYKNLMRKKHDIKFFKNIYLTNKSVEQSKKEEFNKLNHKTAIYESLSSKL